MTIREYVERRGLVVRYLAIVWTLAILFAVFVFPERFALIKVWQAACYYPPILLLYVIFAATTKCPQCRANWGEMVWNAANPFSSSFPDQCPHCGMNLGETMQTRTGKS